WGGGCGVGAPLPVYFGSWVSVVAQCGRTAAAVAQPRGRVTQVDPARQKLAGAVVALRLDVELDAGGRGNLGDLVGGPVGIPRGGAERVSGEYIRARFEFHANCGQQLVHVPSALSEQRYGDRVDGEAALLVRLGVFAHLLTASHQVAERHVHNPGVHVHVVPLQTA